MVNRNVTLSGQTLVHAEIPARVCDLEAHIRYCWLNPVKHGFVERSTDWAASSIHRDIRLGRMEPEWRGVEPVGVFGEVA